MKLVDKIRVEKNENIKIDDTDVMHSLPCGDESSVPRGLTSHEVADAVKHGRVNVSHENSGKSYLKIILDNFVTPFNFIWAIVSACLIVSPVWLTVF